MNAEIVFVPLTCIFPVTPFTCPIPNFDPGKVWNEPIFEITNADKFRYP